MSTQKEGGSLLILLLPRYEAEQIVAHGHPTSTLPSLNKYLKNAHQILQMWETSLEKS
jgi:hypothetical protein